MKHMLSKYLVSGGALLEAMKNALGDVLDPVALQAMEVSKAMIAAGASKEEIEEMMAVILNRGGTVSQDFLEAIKEAMESGGNRIRKIACILKYNFVILLSINVHVHNFCYKCIFVGSPYERLEALRETLEAEKFESLKFGKIL